MGMQPPLTHSSLSLRTPRVDMPGLVLREVLGASGGPAHPLPLTAFVSHPSAQQGKGRCLLQQGAVCEPRKQG